MCEVLFLNILYYHLYILTGYIDLTGLGNFIVLPTN